MVDVEALADAVADRLSERLGFDDQLMKISRVAEVLDVSERTVRDMIARGTLPSLKVEGSRRVDAAVVRAYVAARRAEERPSD